LPVLLFGVLQVQMEQGALDSTKVHRIILLNAFVLILNLFLGLFGIGFGNYGESETGELIGSKGFFYAGNEISATLVAIFALIIFVHRDRLRRYSLLILSVVGLFFVVSLVSMSKTSLLGFLLVTLFALYNYLSLANKIKFGMMLGTVLLASAVYWLPLLQLSIERWEYFWTLRPDLLDFITSGRAERVENYVAWLTGAQTPWPLIFGEGQTLVGAVESFENDLLDVTRHSGVLGLLFYGVWSGWARLGLSARLRQRRPEGSFTLYMVGMFLVLSVVAGHVIYSATLAPFIALLALTSSRYFPGNVAASTSSASHP
jgi:Ca2+/Na+ antiporter